MLNHRKILCRLAGVFCTAALCYPANSSAGMSEVSDSEDYFDLPLETLLDIEVTSVSKKSERVSGAAAAIYVITREDLRRSGATSIPEALRVVPGLQVAQIDSNKWAISARGFNRQFSNKLLVLIDGRSVYTPLFSGVYWDVQDTVLEDIERIEVIRGPGATLWGANAVNGVINIITRKAQDTQGNLVSAGFGNYETGFGTVRHGGKINDHTYFRAFAKHNSRGEFETPSGFDAGDDWKVSRGGFRVDSEYGLGKSATFQGDLYSGEKGYPITFPVLSGAGATSSVNGNEQFEGGNLLARWNNRISNSSDTVFQVYFDHISRDLVLLGQKRYTIDFDFQHNWQASSRNEVIWGAGYRYISDSLRESLQISYTAEERRDTLYSAFIQDKITLMEDKWFLTIGSKFEHNDYTGFEYQPSIRTSWIIDENHTLWGAVSRAVRTPSRNEADILLANLTFAPGVFASQVGTRFLDSENLVAYEIGYRTEPTDSSSVDITAFFNDYDDLRTTDVSGTNGTIIDPSFGNTLLVLPLENKGAAESYGVETALSWNVTGNWKLSAAYTFLSLNLHVDADSGDTTLENDEGRSAKNQFNIRSQLNLPNNFELDNFLYYVDNLAVGIDNYIRFDTRIGWRPTKSLELSLVGQNLFDDWHQEFEESLYASPSQIGRSFYGKATVNF